MSTCRQLSLDAAEPLAGTAPTTRGHFLIEHPGPWLPQPLDSLGHLAGVVAGICEDAGVTGGLIRRHEAARGERAARTGTTLLISVPDDGGVLLTRTIADLAELEEAAFDIVDAIDVARDGEVSDGWERVQRPVITVCTHGRRDQCCAAVGRDLASALVPLAGDGLWETTHLNGHRFAPTALVLPSGVLYGRVVPAEATRVWEATRENRVVPEFMRGRTSLTATAQVAEIGLREKGGVSAEAGVILLDETLTRLGDTVRSVSEWEVNGQEWEAVVEVRDGAAAGLEPRRFSCAKDKLDTPPLRQVVSLEPLGDVVEPAVVSAAAGPDRPDPTVMEIVSALTPGSALDIACGQGRHSVMLAGLGWSVTAIDKNDDAVAHLDRRAADAGLRVRTQVVDASEWAPPEGTRYDLVLMTFVALPEVFSKAAKWVAPGGRLVLVGHSISHATEGVGGPSNPAFLHDPIALAARATGARLRVLRVGEVRRDGSSGPAVHAVLVAVNPGE